MAQIPKFPDLSSSYFAPELTESSLCCNHMFAVEDIGPCFSRRLTMNIDRIWTRRFKLFLPGNGFTLWRDDSHTRYTIKEHATFY